MKQKILVVTSENQDLQNVPKFWNVWGKALTLKRAIQKDSEIKFSYFFLFVGFVRCCFQLALFRYKSNWALSFL